MDTFVRLASLQGYPEICREFGLDSVRLMEQHGINQTMLQQPDLRIPTQNVLALLEQSAQESGFAGFALKLAERRKLSFFGTLGLLMSHQKNMYNVLQLVIDHRQLLSNALMIQHERVHNQYMLVLDVLVGPKVKLTSGKAQSVELTVGIAYQLFAEMLGSVWQPGTIHFTHSEPADLSFHQKFFKCGLQFNSDFNGITCPVQLVDLPNPKADPALLAYGMALLEKSQREQPNKLEDELRQLLIFHLPQGRSGIEQIAPLLSMTSRTLQRRMAEQQISYPQLLDQVRRELVLRYLDNPKFSLSRVADLLGYANSSSFTRWFVKQFGEVPSRFRR